MAGIELPRPMPVVVGTAVAAAMLDTSPERVRELVHAGLIETVPDLSSATRIQIAVIEIERFAARGMTQSANGNLRVIS